MDGEDRGPAIVALEGDIDRLAGGTFRLHEAVFGVERNLLRNGLAEQLFGGLGLG